MQHKLFIDRSYKTSLGTAFYDRVQELATLDRLVESINIIIVYGPRNVGKSELLKYWAYSRQVMALRIDARLLRARRFLELMGFEYIGLRKSDVAKRLVKEFLFRLGVDVSLLDLVLWALTRLSALGERIVIVIDEFHELPRYSRGYEGYREALGDLRSLAPLLLKKEYFAGEVKVLLTVSEGFAATDEARSALEGYSTEWLLVEHMDVKSFKALYNEYIERHLCKLSFNEILGLVGASPGHLAELCPLDKNTLLGKITNWAQGLEVVLGQVKTLLEKYKGGSVKPIEVIEVVSKLFDRPIKPLKEALEHQIGQILVKNNIAYPKWVQEGIMYKPNYPIYNVMIKTALEEGLDSITLLNPSRILEELNP